jgi:hypothetical protein
MFLVLPLALAVACGTESAPAEADADKAAMAEKGDGHDAHGDHAEKGEHHADHADHDGHDTKTAAAVKDGWAHYGEAFTQAEAKDCASLIADPDAHVDQTVRVTGQIDNVCQKKGCWMVIADADGQYMRVTMKDHAFGVPTDTTTGEGTLADIEGTLIKKELDEKTLEHLKSEAKGSAEELEKQFAPKYEIVATGVALKQG